jgi:hypothetical protein
MTQADPGDLSPEIARALADPDFERYIDHLVSERIAETERAKRPETREHLRELFKRLQLRHDFAPGQLVQWKQGLKNRRLPEYGVPVIVLEVLSEPVTDAENGAGSAYFREPLSLVLGVLLQSGDLGRYHYDGQRFEPYPE